MRILIDTYVFIWWTSEPTQLSSLAYNFLTNPETEPILSIVSI